jgi:hypothetical protein
MVEALLEDRPDDDLYVLLAATDPERLLPLSAYALEDAAPDLAETLRRDGLLPERFNRDQLIEWGRERYWRSIDRAREAIREHVCPKYLELDRGSGRTLIELLAPFLAEQLGHSPDGPFIVSLAILVVRHELSAICE